nr:hypothetical protein [Tanacetum cinerariifolium]
LQRVAAGLRSLLPREDTASYTLAEALPWLWAVAARTKFPEREFAEWPALPGADYPGVRGPWAPSWELKVETTKHPKRPFAPVALLATRTLSEYGASTLAVGVGDSVALLAGAAQPKRATLARGALGCLDRQARNHGARRAAGGTVHAARRGASIR